LECLLLAMPQEVFDSLRQSFKANKAKGSTCSLSMGALVVRKAANGGSM
jgi:hypothetical protein